MDEEMNTNFFPIKIGTYVEIYRVFEICSEQMKIPLNRLKFSHYGKDISTKCGRSLTQLGISSRNYGHGQEYEIILVTKKKGGSISSLVETQKPRSFERQRVAYDYGGVTYFGTVVDYNHPQHDNPHIAKRSIDQHRGTPYQTIQKTYQHQSVSFHPDTIFRTSKQCIGQNSSNSSSLLVSYHHSKHEDSGTSVSIQYQDQNGELCGWKVIYDDGDETIFSSDELIDALEHYETHRDRDFGVAVEVNEHTRRYTVRTVSQSGEVSVRHDGGNIVNANIRFDDWVSNVHSQNGWESRSLEDVLDFWLLRHRLCNVTKEEASLILCHSLHAMWHHMQKIGFAGIRDASTLFILKPYLLTYGIMKEYASFGSMIQTYQKRRNVEEIVDEYPAIYDVYNYTSNLGLMAQYINHIMISPVERPLDPTYNDEDEVSIVFIDTKSDRMTEILYIDMNQQLEDILSLYAERHHIPISIKHENEKIQFMYKSRLIMRNTTETPAMLGMGKGALVTVFRWHEPRSDLNVKFHDAAENVECILGDDENEEDRGSISFVDTITYKQVRFHFKKTATLKKVLESYADYIGYSIHQLSFSHRGSRLLFLTYIGKKTPGEVCFDLHDFIIVSLNVVPPKKKPRKAVLGIKDKSNGKKNKKYTKNKKKKPVHIAPPEDEEDILRKLWMDSISFVFAEAEPTFREIRQRLNAMNLERTKPKQKKMAQKELYPRPINHNIVDDIAGKAGRSQFIVLVGEPSNLYKQTQKRSSKKESGIMIDLHGMTKEDALAQLDDALPTWIESAMKGVYPFVIPVKIICGKGNQILADVVENWIKKNDTVANAPKNYT